MPKMLLMLCKNITSRRFLFKKALASLAESGRISFKEYGKQKIYIARQDQFDIPNSEKLDKMKKENARLQQELEDQRKATNEVEGEIRALQSNMTLEQIFAKVEKLRTEIEEMETKLKRLREGVRLVRPEDRKAVEKMYTEGISQWGKRKTMFRDLWDTMTENSPKDLKEFRKNLD